MNKMDLLNSFPSHREWPMENVSKETATILPLLLALGRLGPLASFLGLLYLFL